MMLSTWAPDHEQMNNKAESNLIRGYKLGTGRSIDHQTFITQSFDFNATREV